MKNKDRIIALIALLCIVIGSLAFIGCTGGGNTKIEEIDYVAQLSLNMDSETKKQKVTVYNYIDGDTTHFKLSEPIENTNILKARYLAINTPESTGKIEEYGKAASNFTHEKLQNAKEIYIESNDNKWNRDSTGVRFLVWVWYNTESDSTFRNLNLEILQKGLAVASSIGGTRYASICQNALDQAKQLKLKIYSGTPDPDYFYGEAIECTLRDLRLNIEYFNGKKVAFEANVWRSISGTLYCEDYDEKTDRWYGMQIYNNNNGISAEAKEFLTMGNRVRIVGTVSYWETGATYQVSGLEYDPRPEPGTEKNYIKLIKSGVEPNFLEINAAEFTGKQNVELELNDEVKKFDYAELALYTSVKATGLKVKKVYTTTNPDSSSVGAMTLTCEKDGKTIIVRTGVWRDENMDIVTAADLENKTIDIQGVVEYYDENYQIKAELYSDLLRCE